jgi:hypothetical protein
MNSRYRFLNVAFFSCILCAVAFKPAKAPAAPGGQQSSNTPPTSPTVVKAQTNLVLVDPVVTDKDGNCVKHLEAKRG